MKLEMISKREFWLGMSLITLSMLVVNYIYPIPMESTATIKIQEIINCETSNEGVVECE